MQGVRRSLPSLALGDGTPKRAICVALFVGLLLNLINQPDGLLGSEPIVLWKFILTFMVPYCVTTYGAVCAKRSMGE
ncbi:MAG: hypothetical protein P1U65_16380 [Minwuia sp.]|nr:hypothetical protein [Minwuia sp.]